MEQNSTIYEQINVIIDVLSSESPFKCYYNLHKKDIKECLHCLMMRDDEGLLFEFDSIKQSLLSPNDIYFASYRVSNKLYSWINSQKHRALIKISSLLNLPFEKFALMIREAQGYYDYCAQRSYDDVELGEVDPMLDGIMSDQRLQTCHAIKKIYQDPTIGQYLHLN